MKMIKVDDMIEYCESDIPPLRAVGQSVAVAALRRVIAVAKEYAVDAEPVKHGHWIPCSERMPEDNTIVLYVWCSENGNVSVLHGWHSSIRGLGSAWHQSGVGMQRPDDEVTHWMPLPEPPKDW